MAIPSGLGAQLMIAEETVWGTAVTPTRGYEFRDESIKQEIELIKSPALRAGARYQRTGRVAQGKISVGGDVTMDLMNKSQGIWWKHIFGGVATTQPDVGNSPTVYLHTFTPDELPTGGLTVQVGRPSIDGTARPFTYAGMSIVNWELAAAVGDIATLKVGLLGRSETTGTALAAASYPSNLDVLTFVQGTLELDDTAVDVMSASVSGTNGLAEDRYFLGSALRKKPLQNALHECTGSLEAEFTDLTAYNRFVNKTEAKLELIFTGGIIEDALPYKVVLTANVIFTGETPSVGGPEIIAQPLPFEVIDNGTTSVKLEYTTTDALP